MSQERHVIRFTNFDIKFIKLYACMKHPAATVQHFTVWVSAQSFPATSRGRLYLSVKWAVVDLSQGRDDSPGKTLEMGGDGGKAMGFLGTKGLETSNHWLQKMVIHHHLTAPVSMLFPWCFTPQGSWSLNPEIPERLYFIHTRSKSALV